MRSEGLAWKFERINGLKKQLQESVNYNILLGWLTFLHVLF